jgi:hypothetical protein
LSRQIYASSPSSDLTHSAASDGAFVMDWSAAEPHSPGNASAPHAGMASSSSGSDLTHRRFVGKDTLNHRPGSALTQQLVDTPLLVKKCDDCPRQVVRRVSTMLERPGSVFFKCRNDEWVLVLI